MRKEYTTVKIPVELSYRLDGMAKELGYSSRAEIVNDAIRRFLESREENKIKESGRRAAVAVQQITR